MRTGAIPSSCPGRFGAPVPTARVVPRRAEERDRDTALRLFRLSLSLFLFLSLSLVHRPGRFAARPRWYHRRVVVVKTPRTWTEEVEDRGNGEQARHAVGSVVAPRARVHGYEREVSEVSNI